MYYYTDYKQTCLSHVPSCHNVVTLNSSVPDCRWSQWRSRRWCDTWDPDRGLEEPLQPHSLTLTSASLLWDWYFSRTRGHLHQILSPGLKNRQFRQHFSTGRYCSVGEGASVADLEGEVHNDHLPRWDWIYCPHTLPRNLGTPRKTWQEMWIVHRYNTNAASVALVWT